MFSSPAPNLSLDLKLGIWPDSALGSPVAVGCLGQPVSQERLAFGFPSLLGPVSGVTGESRSDTKGWMETKWDDESGGWESGQGYTERPGSHTRKSCPSSLKMMKRRLWLLMGTESRVSGRCTQAVAVGSRPEISRPTSQFCAF